MKETIKSKDIRIDQLTDSVNNYQKKVLQNIHEN